MRRAVFLDRDGVLNEAMVRDGRPYPPRSVAELRITPGAPESLQRLRRVGFALICVTNQPDLARGALSAENAAAINRRLQDELGLDDILVCPHDDADGCDCRKPKPGLLRRGASKHALDLAASYMVGDRWRDIDAGVAAGCATVLIDHSYDERAPSIPPAARVASIVEATTWILGEAQRRASRRT